MARLVEIGSLCFYEPTMRQINGRFYMRFYEPEMRPKQKELALHTNDERTARTLFDKRRNEYLLGLYDPWNHRRMDGVTLEEALEEYLADQDVRKSTLKCKRVRIGPLVESHPSMMVSGVTPEMIQDYCLRPELQNSTKQRYLYELRHFLDFCKEEGWITSNPASEVIKKLPRHRKRQKSAITEYLSPAEVQLLIETIMQDTKQNSRRSDRIVLAEIIRFAVLTGMRLGEICRLKWKDVILHDVGSDPDKAQSFGWILIRSVKGGETKTGDEARVPIVRHSYEQLVRLRSNSNSKSNGFVFPAVKSKKVIQGWWVSNRFREYRRMAGIREDIHFHSLRHTCASWLAENGVELQVIMQVLRHSNIRQTLRYAHLNPNVIARAVSTAMGNINI